MAPIVKRSLLRSAASLMLLYMAWEIYMLQPPSQEEYPVISESLNMEILGTLSDWAMPNRRPEFTDFPAIKTLDPAFLPDYEQSFFSIRRRRLVFIGDVHGCFDERRFSNLRRASLSLTPSYSGRTPEEDLFDPARSLDLHW